MLVKVTTVQNRDIWINPRFVTSVVEAVGGRGAASICMSEYPKGINSPFDVHGPIGDVVTALNGK